MKLREGDFERVQRVVGELCGLVLGPEKGYLVENRLGPVLERHGISSYPEFCQQVVSSPQGALATAAVDAITTHETSFFRDTAPFDAFRFKALPELLDARQRAGCRRLRIWSAACSTGQEAYSLAILVARTLGSALSGWQVEIVGSDVSAASVAKAREGVYTELEVDRCGLPEELTQHITRAGSGWRISEALRGLVRFETRNLLESVVDLGTFDVVFCRNVAIYFEREARRDLFLRLRDRLAKPDGVLFVGGSENLADVDASFVPQHHCRSVFYTPHAPARAPLGSGGVG